MDLFFFFSRVIKTSRLKFTDCLFVCLERAPAIALEIKVEFFHAFFIEQLDY